MARMLYRLARSCHRRRSLVVVLWLVAVAGLVVGAVNLKQPTNDEFSIPGVESQQANDLLAERFPEVPADGAAARVVFRTTHAAAGGVTDPEQRTAIERSVADLAKVDGVVVVDDPFRSGMVSADGDTALAAVTFAEPSQGVSEEQKDAVLAAAESAESDGLDVVVGGNGVQAAEEGGATSEAIGFLVAFLVLALTFGSLVAAGLPLLTALVGVASGLAGIYLMTSVADLNSTAPVLALMLGIAVGVDYALFVISRYRSELIRGHPPREAAGRAAGTAGSAVVFAGLTVVIALAGLAVVGIPFLTVMGLAAAATVALAVLIALTLLPALLGFTGRGVLRFRVPFARRPDRDDTAENGPPTLGSRWAALVTRRRGAVLVLAVVALGILAIPALSLRTGLPTDAIAAEGSDARASYELVEDEFGAGVNGPLSVVVTGPGVGEDGPREIVRVLEDLDDVASVAPPVVNQEGDTAIVGVIPESGPTSEATADLVHEIREVAGGLEQRTDTDLAVTGSTAVAVDVSESLNDALPTYLLVVIGLAFVLLMMVFRSVLVPLKATLGFLLTVGATIGALVVVFQWGWLSGLLGVSASAPIVAFIPILVIAIVFGLAMDYEVFLMSRLREQHSGGAPAQVAVVQGVRQGARVVTAAAIIMIAVFAGFVLRDDVVVKSIGFALAVGVLVDAFVVRMTIGPAVMALLGRHAWWMPRWLERVVPDVDVEGHTLDDRGPATTTDPTPT